MRSLFLFFFFTLFILTMDLYAMRGIQYLAGGALQDRAWFSLLFWGLSLSMLAALVWAGTRFQMVRDPGGFAPIMVVMGIFLMLYLPKLLFNLTQLLGDLSGIVLRLAGQKTDILKYFLIPGAAAGLLLLFVLGMGMLRGRTRVKVFREELTLSELPPAFEGLRIVQLSDFHLAGFYRNRDHIARVVREVNGLEPDLVLFTGDMVHNFAEEVDPFITILNDLKAPLGKFAILGNHDYGHYYRWDSPEEESDNLERVKAQIRKAGFDLLLNEHRTVSRNGNTIEILGVENWGKPPFPRKGNLEAAMAGCIPGHVKILLSHDPSHWDLRVRGKEEIALTLSGHTHGMQFGFEIGKLRWSPSRWTYKHWAGLYSENGQYLYVSRGLGFTGYPGRVGIRPEITLITLRRKAS